MIARILLFFWFFTLSVGNVSAVRPDYRALPYNEHPAQNLDVFLPEDVSEPVPTLVMFHGGGFVFGTTAAVNGLAEYFVERGYAVVTPRYRFAPEHQYPAQVEDAFCALAWVHTYADAYGFDTSRIVVIGESAGGNLALMLSAVETPEQYRGDCPHVLPESDWTQGVVAYYPMVDLSTCECVFVKEFAAAYLGVTFDLLRDDAEAAWGEASPRYWLDGTEASTLLIHGTADEVVPDSESIQLAAELEALDVPVELPLIEGANHAFIGEIDTDEGLFAAEAVEVWLATLFADLE